MKTQITKENALIIIDTALRTAISITKLERVLGTDLPEWGGSFAVIEPLFNVDLGKVDNDVYMKFFNAFFDEVEDDGVPLAKKSEIVYTKILALSLELEEEQEKATNISIMPGVISLLKGQNYKINGRFSLDT